LRARPVYILVGVLLAVIGLSFATMAQSQCPSTCSCLLPGDAKAKGYTSLCGGKQTLCGYDKSRNPMYCYQKPSPTATTKATTTPTTLPVTSCPSACSCLLPADAKAKGLTSLCGGKEILCGYDQYQNRKYCYQVPATATATPAPVLCPSSCSCMDAAGAKQAGYTTYCGNSQAICGYDQYQSPKYCFVIPTATTQGIGAVSTRTPGTLVTPAPPTLPVAAAPGRCTISGNIYRFFHDPHTLRIRVTNLDSGTDSMQDVTPVYSGDLVSHYSYLVLAGCNGNYRIEPVYEPYPGACRWTGTFAPARSSDVHLSGTSETGWDFTYVPEDSRVPDVSVVPNPATPEMDQDVRINIEAVDDSSIVFMAARYEMIFVDGTRRSVDWQELAVTPGIAYRPGDTPPQTGHFTITDDRLARIEVTARVCDSGGNERWGSGTVMFGSCSDRVQNRDELGIDCGGAYCPACRECAWCGEDIVPLLLNGNPDDKIDVVFIPDTSYGGNRDTFIDDVWDAIENGYYANDAISGNRNKFNFYYLDDEADVTAYPACGFTPPLGSCEAFQDATTFADSLAVLHTDNFRDWSSTKCGRRVFSSEPTSYRTFVHESGHSVFGLKDEYCCDSHYSQNNPNPNIWQNETACRNDALTEGWDPDDCDNFCPSGSGNCGAGFWDIDPNICIMTCSQSCDRCGAAGMCQYEQACLRRVNWVFSQFS